jgi:hypothetical protein
MIIDTLHQSRTHNDQRGSPGVHTNDLPKEENAAIASRPVIHSQLWALEAKSPQHPS